jgi:hypothetical protein
MSCPGSGCASGAAQARAGKRWPWSAGHEWVTQAYLADPSHHMDPVRRLTGADPGTGNLKVASGLSWASGKKRTMSIVLPTGGEAVPSGEAAQWLHWNGKVCICQPRLGTRPGGLGETQAVTTHRSKLILMGGGKGLKLKVMVGGVRRNIRAPGGAGPGRDERQSGWWASCPNAKGLRRGLEPI